MIRLIRQGLAVGIYVAVCTAALAGALGGTAYAQGSRKDDVVFNAQGHPMAGATIRVCTSAATGQPCTPLALVYSDPLLTQALANPLATDGMGNYTFYAAPGRYEIEISGPSITTKQLPNVILPSDPSTPTFTTVTTTSGISAFSLALTGNLTVNGSTSVAGTLSVGGAPVPSTGADNQWAGNQRFKGPIPWRDFTAYMRDSNGNAVNCSSTDTAAGADTTGTISATSHTVSIAAAVDFKNGCGIAIVGAGPAATIVTPPSTVTVASAASSSNVVTITTSGNHNLLVGSGTGVGQGVVVTGCSNTAYNGTFPIQTIATSTTFTYNTTSSGTGSTTGCAASVFFGYAHGIAGSTTYKYKIAAVDANMGMSASSATAVTITNGNASPSKYNYNHLMWAQETGAYMYAVYSDKGLGGALTCVGMAFINGYSDMGLPFPCPVYVPTNPPSSATSDALNTTITSGGGTTTLTLTGAASTAVTSANVYHDESSFVTACVNDAITDQGSPSGNFSGSYGCFIPEGSYWINGPMPTATVNPQSGGVIRLRVAGNIILHTNPWFIGYGGYVIEGVGATVGSGGSFDRAGQVALYVASQVPAAVVYRNFVENSNVFSNFVIGPGAGLNGDGIFVDGTNFTFDNDSIAVNSGAAYRIETGSQYIHIDDNVLYAGGSNTLPAILFDFASYNSPGAGVAYINNLVANAHGIGFIGPGGNGAGGQTNSIFIRNWLQEDQDPLDNGMIWIDSGPNATGASDSLFGLLYANIENTQNSDIALQYNNLFALSGTAPNAIGDLSLENVQTEGLVACVNGATICSNGNLNISNFFSAVGPPNLGDVASGSGGGNGFVQDANYGIPTSNAANVSIGPMVLTGSTTNGTYAAPAWAMVLPAPNQLSVTGTGSGGLAANTYCIGIAGTDSTGHANETNLSNIVCQAVGSSSDINLQWDQGVGSSMSSVFGGFTLYYCTVSSGTCTPNEKITGLASGVNPVTYSFTSTSGAVSGTPNANSEAQLSWLSWDSNLTPYSCFFCTSGGHSDYWPVGFGMAPTGSVGVNIFTKLGIRAGTQYQAAESAAPSGIAAVDQLWADSTAHQWKKIENNGATFTVAGTLSGTTGSIGGSALTAGQCASGTVSVSSATTSMTVSVSPNTYPGDGFIPWGYVSASGTVTVKVCAQAAGTPTSSTYNVRVIQ